MKPKQIWVHERLIELEALEAPPKANHHKYEHFVEGSAYEKLVKVMNQIAAWDDDGAHFDEPCSTRMSREILEQLGEVQK